MSMPAYSDDMTSGGQLSVNGREFVLRCYSRHQRTHTAAAAAVASHASSLTEQLTAALDLCSENPLALFTDSSIVLPVTSSSAQLSVHTWMAFWR
jgi:hypothetical protein